MYDYVKIPYRTRYFESNRYIKSVQDWEILQQHDAKNSSDIFADGIVLKQDNVFGTGDQLHTHIINISFLYISEILCIWISI